VFRKKISLPFAGLKHCDAGKGKLCIAGCFLNISFLNFIRQVSCKETSRQREHRSVQISYREQYHQTTETEETV
jgi:hypothetical protein